MRVLALIPARNEAGRVGDTVRAVRSLSDVDEIVVIDDGSTDATAAEAAGAGARVLVSPVTLGKGGALEGALDRVVAADAYVFLDADLGVTAKEAGVLLAPVIAGQVDLSIAALPRQAGHGGFRLVKRLSAAFIRRLSGFRADEPMSGQRAMTASALAVLRPLAPGFSIETAMTIDAVRRGLRVREISVPMAHAPTGRDLRGFLHRARQGRDVVRAGLSRLFRS